LLDWHGEPFIRVAAQTALSVGLSPVVVVTGANADEVESKIKDLPVMIVRNENWQADRHHQFDLELKCYQKKQVPQSFF